MSMYNIYFFFFEVLIIKQLELEKHRGKIIFNMQNNYCYCIIVFFQIEMYIILIQKPREDL